MKNKKTTVFLWGAIILNLVLVGVYVLAFNGVRTQTEETSISSNTLREYQDEGENIALVKNIFRETREGVAPLDGHIVTSDTVVSFIETVEAIGVTAGISLTLSTLRDEGNTLTFSVSTVGSFNNNMYFMTLMDHLPFLLEITNASLVKQSQDKDGNTLYDMWGGVYSFALSGFIGK